MAYEKLLQVAGRIPGLSSTLRWWAGRYDEGSVARIRSGLAAGYLWKRHHRYVNGYWLGHYELPIQEVLRRELRGGDRFYDVGANAGFFTLVAARLVGSDGSCVAFDPAPDNVRSVREQIELNALAQCTVVQQAVGGAPGRASFSFAYAGAATGHIGTTRDGEQSLEVEVTTLDDALERYGPPRFVKMDIEGAEIEALHGARRMLSEVRPTWLIELHGPECERAVLRVLGEHGYRLMGIDSNPVVATAPPPKHVLAKS
jgi:FkbM family methyltransferase